jgi:hypothetical protein
MRRRFPWKTWGLFALLALAFWLLLRVIDGLQYY